MTTETITFRTGERDEYIFRGASATPIIDYQDSSASSTQTAHRSLVGARLLAPFVVAAAFAAPQVPTSIRRLFSAGERSRSEIIDRHWALDDWQYTEEVGTLHQVRALNALLALPSRDGFSLDLPE